MTTRAIIFDKLQREEDIIFNPIDERSAQWTIFNDCTSKMR